jgi:hypothetical protein
MLKQVSEARASLALVAGADVVPDLEVDDGAAVILGHHDSHAIGELLFEDGELGWTILGGERNEERRSEQESGQFLAGTLDTHGHNLPKCKL